MQEVDALIKRETEKEIDSYADWYKESEFFKIPSLREVFGDEIANAISSLKDSRCEDLPRLMAMFENMAIGYGRKWWDEDTSSLRSGYRWECSICTELRNICAKKIGAETKEVTDFYME